MKDNKFIPALTGIRAICVYLIFLKHFEPFNKEKHPYLFAFFDQFYIFLSFFFVLSGFLIYYKYHSVASFDSIKLRKYFLSRVARIFPVLFILTAISFFLGYNEGLYEKGNALKLFVLNITLLKGFSSEYYLTGIGPSWSLSVEELFYISAPVIFMIGKTARSLLMVLIFIYLAGLIITVFFIRFPAEGFFSSLLFTFSYTFFGRCFEFFCGIWLAKFLLNKENIVPPVKGKKALVTGIVIILIALIGLWQLSLLNDTRHGIDVWKGIVIHNLALPVGISFFFYGLIYYKGKIAGFLSSPLMVALGHSTYSFYLLHTSFVLSLIFKYVSDNFFISLFCMILFSYVFYKLIEQPMALLIKKAGKSND